MRDHRVHQCSELFLNDFAAGGTGLRQCSLRGQLLARERSGGNSFSRFGPRRGAQRHLHRNGPSNRNLTTITATWADDGDKCQAVDRREGQPYRSAGRSRVVARRRRMSQSRLLGLVPASWSNDSCIPPRNTRYCGDQPPGSRATDQVTTVTVRLHLENIGKIAEPNESIMTFDSRSAALQPVDLVVSHAGVPDRTAFMPWHNLPLRGSDAGLCCRASARRGRRADASARPEGTAERAGMDGARVQPTANQFVPPDQPDVSARPGQLAAVANPA
jgi:hypothetical protein